MDSVKFCAMDGLQWEEHNIILSIFPPKVHNLNWLLREHHADAAVGYSRE